MTTAIIIGSSRSQGNTRQLVDLYLAHQAADVFDLANFDLSFYDYQHRNSSDDFSILIEKLARYQHIIFASPVYWYAMSAQMKVFFDRLSDLLTINQSLGRELRGRTCAVLATGVDENPPACFEQPFKLTANYLGMRYSDMFYAACAGDFMVQQHQAHLSKYVAKEQKWLAE